MCLVLISLVSFDIELSFDQSDVGDTSMSIYSKQIITIILGPGGFYDKSKKMYALIQMLSVSAAAQSKHAVCKEWPSLQQFRGEKAITVPVPDHLCIALSQSAICYSLIG